jgi:Uri superfamily endonuclease
MKSESGTYALILRSQTDAIVEIGLWRQIKLKSGYYVYIGSAFGPGGVQARVLRHYRKKKSSHWHIDYLTEFMSPIFVLYSHETRHREHEWAQVLYKMNDMSPIQGFGCSDCKCYSHLFHTSNVPDLVRFSNLVGDKVELWTYQIAD